MLFNSYLSALLFAFTSSFPSVFAHLAKRSPQDSPCSCADISSADDGITQYAPIPDSALGVNVSASTSGYVTQQVAEDAYVVYSNTHQGLFLVSDEGVIVVDNPASIGENMLYAIGNVTDKPVRKFIYSHAHNDHVGGAGFFAGDEENPVDFIAHSETEILLQAVSGDNADGSNSDNNRPLPTKTFDRTLTVELGNQVVELAYYGPNHQPGNIFVYVPSSKILMLVDIIYPGWVPFLDLALVDFVPGFVNAHDIVLSNYDFDVFIGGHYNRVGNRADVEAAREYIHDLRASCRNVLTNNADPNITAAVDVSPVVALNPNNRIAAGKFGTEQSAELCAEPVLEKWLGKLAAVDTAVISHASRMIFGLRIEYGEFN